MKYITFGKKKNPAIVFLHGWGGCAESWGVIPARLAGFGYYSIVIDFSDFKEWPNSEQGLYVLDFAIEVKELLENLKITDVSFVGHSFGGRIAVKIAGLKMVEVKKLVLVDSAGLKPRRGLKYKYNVWRYKSLKKRVECGKANKDCLEKYGSADYKALSSIERKTFINVVNEELSPNAQNIDCPTLLVWGKNDKDTPFYMARKFKKLIKNSRLEVYPAGHFSYLECMDEFIDDVYGFLLSS